MRLKLLVAASFTLMAVSAIATTGYAAPISHALTSIASTQDTVVPVQYRNYCGRWYQECRARWGAGWRFRRCLAIRGCL